MYLPFGNIFGLKLFRTKPFIKFAVLLIFLAVITEFLQIWVPSRTFSTVDILSNVSGVILGIIIAGTVFRYKSKVALN